MYRNFTLFTDGKNAFPAILEAIGQAKKTVHINMFIWRDDAIGNRMARAILEAADRGVDVTVSVDRYGLVLEKAEECKRSFFHKDCTLPERLKIVTLELAYPMPGAPKRARDEETPLYRAVMNHPHIHVSSKKFKADHSKYYIIDGETLFLGGINIEDKENGRDLQGRVYQDYMVRLRGREYVEAFRAKLTRGQDLASHYSFGVNTKKPRRFEMERRYLELIGNARQELYITMAYFSPLKPFLDAILAAHRRGVRVVILAPEHANFQDDSNRKTLKKLLKATNNEISVYLSPKMVHTKLMVSEQTVSLGSCNITKKAFRQLDELNLFMPNTDCPLTRQLLASMEENRRLSRKVCWQDIRYRPLMAFSEGFLV